MKTPGNYAMINGMDDSPFLIVGGGIAGLGAALGLSNIGKASRIFEKSAGFQAVGAGLQLGPNAVRALQHLGAWDAVAPHCASPKEIHIRDGVSGKILKRLPLGTEFENRFGAPYRVALRSDLQMALLDTAGARKNIELQTSADVVDVSLAVSRLTLSSGKVVTGKAVIGADGVHSRIRQAINGVSGVAKIGHVLHRALLPISSLSSELEADVVTLWLVPGAHVVHYAVGNGKLLNVVASVENPHANLHQSFLKACEPLSKIVAVPAGWSQWPAFEAMTNSIWTKHSSVLVGDAAHGSLPYLAQGAAMALEDACQLSLAINRTRDLVEAFSTFERLRLPRTRKVQMASRQLGRIYHAGNPLRLARNAMLQVTRPSRFVGQLAWIYDWNCNEK